MQNKQPTVQSPMEELQTQLKTLSNLLVVDPGSLKRKASIRSRKGAGEKLSKTDLKRLRAKANKMKKSTKNERDRGTQLARQVSFAYNMRA